MRINLRWTITNESTSQSSLVEEKYIEKNIFSTITVDCKNGLHVSLLNYFSKLIYDIIGVGQHRVYELGKSDLHTEIFDEYFLVIRKDFLELLLLNKEILNKKGFVLLENKTF